VMSLISSSVLLMACSSGPASDGEILGQWNRSER